MKNAVRIFTVVLLALLLCVTMIACSHDEDEHVASGDWQTSETHHWKGCEDECEGAEVDKAEHTFDNACDADCNVCAYKRTPAAHAYDNACDADCNVCAATRTPAAHAYDNACDATCNVCAATRAITHNYATTLTKGESTHYYACSVCGDKKDEAPHAFNQSVAHSEYLKTAATATTKAVYYKSCVCGKAGTETFEIDKIAVTVTITAAGNKFFDGVAAGAPTYTVTPTDVQGVQVLYKVKNADDSTYTTDAPVDAGVYTVKVNVPESATHAGASATADLTISKGAAEITDIDVTNTGKTYDGNPVNAPEFVANFRDGATVEYKVKDADDSTYTTDVPVNAGNYTVRVSVPETDNYTGDEMTADFTIEKATASITSVAMSANSIVYGDSYEVMVEKENYDGEVIIEYKAKNADDATYETIKPANVGEYTARVTLQEGTNNTGDVETIDFTINAKVLDDLYEIAIENGDSEFTFSLEEIESGLSVRITFEDSSAGADVTNVVILKEGNFCANYAVDLDECYFAIISNVISNGSLVYVTPANYTMHLAEGAYVVEVGNVTGNRDAQVQIYSKADESTPIYEFDLKKNFTFEISAMESGEYIVKVLASADGYFMISEHNSHETIDDYGFCQTCGEFVGVVADTNNYVVLKMNTGDKVYFRFDIGGEITDPDLKLNIDFEDEVSVTYTAYDDNGNVIDLTTTATSFVATNSVYVVIEALQDIDTMVQVEETY